MSIQLLIIFLSIIISFAVQSGMQRAYNKYLGEMTARGLNGYQVASMFLQENGVHDVSFDLMPGQLADHYDPATKTIRLSKDIYYGTSIASVAIACHEAGHALQHAKGYTLLAIRNRLIPTVQVASSLSWICIFIGLLSGLLNVLIIGIVALGIIAIFQLVTLPIELNASNQALAFLDSTILNEDEHDGAKKVLRAAAFTYIAALIISLMQIARFLLIIMNSRRR